jgi:hypothetical protein
MDFNKLVFGGLAAGCLVAAGAGSYLAVRQNASDTVPAAVQPAPASVEAPATPGQPVAESEGVIAPAAETPATEAVITRAEPAAPRRESRVQAREASARSTPARSVRTSRPAPEPAPAAPPPSSGSMWEARPAVEPTIPEPTPETPALPPAPEIIELVIPADSVVGLQIERTVSSETARLEDRVEARVTRDVRVGNRVALPAGAIVQGSVTNVERGGKVKERAQLAVRFHTVVLADGTRVALRTEPIVREGESPAGESTAKIGGAAAGGAILGAILGGGKGAAIGGAIGAAGGTAATMAGGRNPAVLRQGTTVTVRVQQPVTVSVEKEERER